MKRLRAFDKRVLRSWLPLAFISTTVILLIYGVAQQSMRQAANDPQIQVAESAASSLAGGTPTSNLDSLQRIDIVTSLDTFATVFNANGKVIATSGKLGTTNPALPSGVFAYTAAHREDRFTWEPQPNVRIAAVVRSYKTPNGATNYVLVGRNLREVERREDRLLILSTIAWALTLGGSLGMLILLTPRT